MFCPKCGAQLNEGTLFCSKCGNAVSSMQPSQRPNGLIGFSSKINDPAFKKYKKNSVTWSFLFSVILAVIALIAFPIYGNESGEIDWPNSLYYGMGIGGMFIVIALLQTLKRGLDKTWDGTVSYKDTYQIMERSRNGYKHYHIIYKLKIKKDSGGLKKHKWRDTPGLYDYYNLGDKVRHHKGFSYYEKYNKSNDTVIVCAACLAINDISDTSCKRCKCPLLK